MEHLLKYDTEFVIKPSIDSGGGKSVQIGNIINGIIYINDKKLSFTELSNQYISDFLIQEKLEQHEVLNNVYPYSLNTIRLISLKYHGRIHILSTVTRFGNKGSQIDNQSTGGISCGVDKNGNLNCFSIDKKGNKLEKHPYTGVYFKDICLPNFNNVKQLVFNLHNQISYFNLVSWDIAIDREGNPVLIELNLGDQEINFHQFNNGPLFNEYTKTICKK